MQNTLKALIACIDDAFTSSEIRLSCLKLFQKFVVYVTDDDFWNVDLEADAPFAKNHGADPKSEWSKLLFSLSKIYNPLTEPDYAFVILEIYYSLLGL